jgi:hypothetical protein
LEERGERERERELTAVMLIPTNLELAVPMDAPERRKTQLTWVKIMMTAAGMTQCYVGLSQVLRLLCFLLLRKNWADGLSGL